MRKSYKIKRRIGGNRWSVQGTDAREIIYAVYYDSSKEQYQIPCLPFLLYLYLLFNDIFFHWLYIYLMSNVAPTRHVLKSGNFFF